MILVVIAAALAQIAKMSDSWPRSLTFLALLLCTWHIAYEKTYWQMFPALAGLLVLTIWNLGPRRLHTALSQPVKGRLALGVVLLCLMSFGLLLLVPMFVLPKPTGPYFVGTRIIYLKDSSRVEDADQQHPGLPRELVVQIWYPANPSSNHLAAYQRLAETSLVTSYRSVLWTNSRVDAPIAGEGGSFPVLLFNHGWGGRRTQDTFLTEDLASHGYVVAAIDHTYNAGRVALAGDRIIDSANGYDPIDASKHTATEIKKAWNTELQRWVDDEVFVLNALQNENADSKSFWYGRLNTDRAGALGHSFGGAAAIQVCSVDRRIQSALNMDGWTFGNIQHRTFAQPTLFMYEKSNHPQQEDLSALDTEARTLKQLDKNDESEVDASLKQYGGYKLYVSNTSHMDFTDHPLITPWSSWTQPTHISPARIQMIVRAYVLDFFDQTVQGKKSSLLETENPSQFREVQVKKWTP
ncbi:alpha/beta hydrolase family protein [Tunturiibacter lichenicola]|uniref:alpha/beta hydrolase family protein n=1 Tax=Tunturiibacter lichenicola TaxID=2051959 RepID=UPI003D9B888C